MAALEVTETFLSAVCRLEPLIREYADEAERNRRLSQPVVTALAEAGFFRLYLPRTLGGFEVDPLTFCRVMEALARIDGATARLRYVVNPKGCGWAAASDRRSLGVHRDKSPGVDSDRKRRPCHVYCRATPATQRPILSGGADADDHGLLDLASDLRRGQAGHCRLGQGRAEILRRIGAGDGDAPHTLYRLLRALASVGVFHEGEEGRFGLTPLAAYLQTGTSGSLRAFAIMQSELQYRAYGEVLHSVKTGETAFNRVCGQELFPYLTQHPTAATVFEEAMTNYTMQVAAGIVAAYDFSQFGTLVDVGGGYGTLLTAILQAQPVLRGVLFDLPHIAEDAKRRLAAAGLAERCAIKGGDFFAAVPSGGDAYLLKWILHDWDDERAVTLLKNCRQAMAAHGKVLVIEAVIPPGNTPFFHKWVDLTMLVIVGGRERTEAEYRALFEAAGFKLTQIIPTASEMSVIEGVRT